jgi:competence protein ComEC
MKIWNKKTFILIVVLLASLDVLVWRTIIFAESSDNLEIYFLNVGQGDSELVILPGGVKVLIDGGPNNKILNDLTAILQPTDRYLDLVINSHPHPDHFIGLIDVLKNYQVGAFIYNGRDAGIPAWDELIKTAEENKVPQLVLAASDKIHYLDNEFDILSPDKNFINKKDLNETSLAVFLKSQNSKALFVGDIGAGPEKYLIDNFDIDADILKIGHHGSKFSSTAEFLKSVSPKIAVAEVGKNSYGHPTPEVLSRLASFGVAVYRTDTDGTIKLTINNGRIFISKRN